MRSAFQRIWDRSVVVSMARQQAFAVLVGDGSYSLDMPRAILSFDSGLRYRVQCLGSESDGTWLWAWADPSITNQDLLAVARRLEALGTEKGIEEFTTAELPLSAELTGHVLTTIAQQIGKAPLYFSCPTDGGGRIWFLVYPADEHSSLPWIGPEDVNRAFAELLPVLAFNHWIALAQASAEVGGPEPVDGHLVLGGTAYEFDEVGRVTSCEQQIAIPEPTPPRDRRSQEETEPSLMVLPDPDKEPPVSAEPVPERGTRRRPRSRRHRRR